MAKIPAAIVGSGNIGTDLLAKLGRSAVIEPRFMVGIDPESEGLRRAAAAGIEASAEGVDWLLTRPDPPAVVFEATSAAIHRRNAPRYSKAGIAAVDLTPAAVGPGVVPVVNLETHGQSQNVSLVSCGGQATIPMVFAVSRVAAIDYAEIVATVASEAAGPGTRANIDEFTRTTARGLEDLGGSPRAKAIIVLNPAEPPIVMRNTIFCRVVDSTSEAAIEESIEEVAAAVRAYVPGYRLTAAPQFDELGNGSRRVATFVEVEGAGDFLPPYAGNLDIMTSAAVRVGEVLARQGTGSRA